MIEKSFSSTLRASVVTHVRLTLFLKSDTAKGDETRRGDVKAVQTGREKNRQAERIQQSVTSGVKGHQRRA